MWAEATAWKVLLTSMFNLPKTGSSVFKYLDMNLFIAFNNYSNSGRSNCWQFNLPNWIYGFMAILHLFFIDCKPHEGIWIKHVEFFTLNKFWELKKFSQLIFRIKKNCKRDKLNFFSQLFSQRINDQLTASQTNTKSDLKFTAGRAFIYSDLTEINFFPSFSKEMFEYFLLFVS
jgi:hypothetical protein